MIKAVIFDKDGTLFDFQATWGAWLKGALKALCGTDTALQRRIAADLHYDMAHQRYKRGSVVIAGTPLQIAQIIQTHLPHLSVDEVIQKLNNLAEKAPQMVVAGTEQTLQKLRQNGLKLAVMTNDAKAPAQTHLRKGGLVQYFDLIMGSDSGHGEKPAPTPLLAIANKLGVSPADCAMVGDSTHDCIAATRAGMTPIAVLTGPATQEDLSPHAAHVLSSVADLIDWINDINGRQ